ncbi:unnamed protein product [Mesocestoides corti]|uniref:Disintegrin domain-containing protein n=1 Tax=Mesocestoides corti TaxID=53468 RepID=A0A158QVF2_MESCO|nr:unnamed protein product [Mesocestoides corti]
MKSPYIVELYVVTDERFVSSFSHDVVQIVARVNNIFRIVNTLFAQFNVRFVVVGLQIWEKNRVNLEAEEHLLKTLASFKRTDVDVRHDCLFALLENSCFYWIACSYELGTRLVISKINVLFKFGDWKIVCRDEIIFIAGCYLTFPNIHLFFSGDTDQTSTTRGRANKEVMCKYSSCVSFVRDSQYMEVHETARTAAHELGHNFGLRHDTEECECQGCIMATGVEFGTTTMEWSPCSIRDMPNLLHYGMGACLHDTPVNSHSSILPRQSRRLEVNGPSIVHVYTSSNSRRGTPELLQAAPRAVKNSLCGNGKLDPGEECDCGTVDTCPKDVQLCCDVKTCRLRDGAECATGSCCDIQSVFGDTSRTTCKLKQRGSVCREAGNSCDLPEYCDGVSEWCPADFFKTDGEACYTKEGYKSHCIRGGCNAPDEWCRVLWGNTATAAGPGCVEYNLLRNQNQAVDDVANCGRLRPQSDERWKEMSQWPRKACKDWADAECGRLWCTHRNEKAMLMGWQEQKRRVDPHSQRTCVALVYDPVDPLQQDAISQKTGYPSPGWGDAASVTQDAGMVPDGTPCQRGMCYNGTCIGKDDLPFRKTCNCNSNGVCNNRGNCHCNIGYAPPDCTQSGNGGSIDSGPPPPSWHKYGFIFALCFIVFIVSPGFLIFICCLLCQCKNRRLVCPQSGPLPPPSSYGEPFDCADFAKSIGRFCRKCRPQFNNDPPVIIAFGSPGPKAVIERGHYFTANGNVKKGPGVATQNGDSVKTALTKVKDKCPPIGASTVIATDSHNFSPRTFRRELVKEFGSDRKVPGFLRCDEFVLTSLSCKEALKRACLPSGHCSGDLDNAFFRDLEAAWEAAEREAGVLKQPSGSPPSGSNTGGCARVEISTPRLENTTFKGEMQSLASAVRVQQQVAARRCPAGATPRRHQAPPITAFDEVRGRQATESASAQANQSDKPDISEPTLQTCTYKHGLMELPEAYSTLKNPKKGKKPRPTTGHTVSQPKR